MEKIPIAVRGNIIAFEYRATDEESDEVWKEMVAAAERKKKRQAVKEKSPGRCTRTHKRG